VPQPPRLSDQERSRAERVQRQLEREAAVESRRAEARSERTAKERDKEARERERTTRVAAAEHRTAELERQVDELRSLLRRSVRRPPLTFRTLATVRPQEFDPGDDGRPLPAPRPPVMRDGTWFDRRARRRRFDEEAERYERDRVCHDAEESARQERLADARRSHERGEQDRRDAAARRAATLEAGVRDGDETAIATFARLAIKSLPMPRSIRLAPACVYQLDPRKIVVDIDLPDDDVVPVEKSVKYVHARGEDSVKDWTKAERESIYRSILAQLALATTNAVFGAFEPEVVETVTVNGKLRFVDPATGRETDDFLVSLTTGREEIAGIDLDADGLDPVQCVRKLGARLSSHPLARESVPPFLTFDEASFKLGTSIDVASGLDGRANLATIPWPDFEQLVRQLMFEMYGKESRITRGSRDDGIDGVIFDCDAQIGGTYLVQAKRYTKVVPANDVRALAGVMHDKRANLALFVTSAWFGPDAHRFAGDNRVRLIEGTELAHLLKEHLDLEVLVPPYRGRPRKNG
jgi:restriction system protein